MKANQPIVLVRPRSGVFTEIVADGDKAELERYLKSLFTIENVLEAISISEDGFRGVVKESSGDLYYNDITDKAVCSFTTPGQPPLKFLEELSQDWPTLNFDVYWSDDSRKGSIIFSKGKLVSSIEKDQ